MSARGHAPLDAVPLPEPHPGETRGGPQTVPALRLSSEELAELTERVFEASQPARGIEPGVPLDTCLSLFASQHVPEKLVRAAVAEIIERREQRLSSVLHRKAGELERLLTGLLPRLDTSFHAQVKLPVPPEATGRPAPPEDWILYQIAAEKGELEVRALHESPRGTRQLFTLLVRAARSPGRLRRWLGRGQVLPREVRVLDPAGLRLEDLLAWTFDRCGDGPAPGRVVGAAFEKLREAVHAEVERATAFVRDLDFGGKCSTREGGNPCGNP